MTVLLHLVFADEDMEMMKNRVYSNGLSYTMPGHYKSEGNQ